jgi:myo-inositol-1(or 4)-monophosphatase
MNSSHDNYEKILSFAVDLAVRTGDLIKEERSLNKYSIEYKDNNELVTSADLMADDLINSAIKENFPEHVVFSEESSPDFLSKNECLQPLWIIDPIDGSVNYAHNQNQVSVSIAYAENGIVKAGAVHAPFQKETFSALKGKGAYLNGRPVTCSSSSTLKTAVIGTGFPYDKSDIEHLFRRLRAVLANFQDIRRLGSAALDICWTACGRLEGYYETIKPWDLAAGCLIAKEAGCIVGHLTEFSNKIPEDLLGDELVVAPPGIYYKLVGILKEA